MTEKPQTLDQRRALQAWGEAKRASADSLGQLEDAISEMEMRIRLAGLAAALQYEERLSAVGKGEAPAGRQRVSALLPVVEDWIRHALPDTESGRRASDRLAAGDAESWSALTSEVMSYLRWLKAMTRLHQVKAKEQG